MKKVNKGVQTRQGYKIKKKANEILRKVKIVSILFGTGFISGMLYYHIFINSNLKAETSEKELVAQIPYQSENTLNSQEKEEITEELEEVYIECYLDEVSCKIKRAADSYEVDWRLAVAIAKHETGVYTSDAFKNKNNVGGNFGYENGSYQLLTFDNLESGIEYFINNLKVKYIDLGLDTIEEIQPKYAPINADNDPNRLNNYWVSGVTKYFNELEGK